MRWPWPNPPIPVIDVEPYRAGDPGTPRGYSALASKSLERTYGLDTLPTCTEAGHPPRYPPIRAGEHMLAKLERRETRPPTAV